MTDIKRPPPTLPTGISGLHAHAKRDFYRGLMTKNLVKGAGGGARGVDYQDLDAENQAREANAPRSGEAATANPVGGGDAEARGQQNMQQGQGGQVSPEYIPIELVPNAPREGLPPPPVKDEERKKKKKLQLPGQPQDDDEDSGEERGGVDVLAEPNNPAHRQELLSSIARLLADPTTERQVYGAFSLTDPADMKKTLSTPSRVAKHLLVLAGRMVQRGQPRPEVLEYVASTFLKLGPDFGKRAFKDFSASLGIGALYPLEVRERLVLLDDAFLPTLKCRFTSTKRSLQGKVKETLVIEYPEDMTITEFAVKGGSRKGYQLLPLKEKGKHGLRFFEPGEYRVLLMGIDPMGFERLEEIRIDVTGVGTRPTAVAAAAAPRRASRFSFDKLREAREARGQSPGGGGQPPKPG